MIRLFATTVLTSMLTAVCVLPNEANADADVDAKAKSAASWNEEHKKQCDTLYRGKIQAGIRRACYLGGTFTEAYLSKPSAVAETACRLQYGEEPGETYACLIGTAIARELTQSGPGPRRFQKAFQLCSEVYPMRTELDSYLLESCLVGVYAPSFVGTTPKFDLCTTITHERSFYGPCAVGVGLAPSALPPTTAPGQETSATAVASPAAASKTGGAVTASTNTAPSHRSLCEQYFDHLRFHLGYRSCLNARAVKSPLLERAQSLDELRNRCDAIVSDSGNDHERAACVVGAAFFDSVLNNRPLTVFERCGVNQVRYEDRDFLGCLVAGSILFFKEENITSTLSTDRTCRDIFRDRKSQALSGCLNSIVSLSKPKE